MKRVLCFGVVLTLVLSLAACKSEEPPVVVDNTPSQSVEQPVEDPIEQEAPEVEPQGFVVPYVDKGIISVMFPSDQVDDVEWYMDLVLDFCMQLWPDEVKSGEVKYFDSYGYRCIDLEHQISDDDTLFVRFSVNFEDDDFSKIEYQRLDVSSSWLPYGSLTADDIFDIIYEYAGLQYSKTEIETALVAAKAEKADTVLELENGYLYIGDYMDWGDSETFSFKLVFTDSYDWSMWARIQSQNI